MEEVENRMGVMPVKPLLLQMAWPMMLSMFVEALYNLVDSIFISQYSQDAFVALGLAFPVQMMMIAICVGTGIGVNAMVARRLGEKRVEDASAVAMNGFFLYLLSWMVFFIFGLTVGPHFVGFFTSNASVAEYGRQYLTIVTMGSIGICMQFAAERVMQATGNSKGPMIVQGVGAVINLILDPILIFGIEGIIPSFGVTGAAVATIIGQMVGMAIGLVMMRHNKIIHFRFRSFRPNGKVIGEIYRIGVPAMVMQSLMTVMTLGMNKILAKNEAQIFILSAYFKLQNFIFMPAFGLNNGMVPILGYNYGAKNGRRISDTIHFGLILSVAIMAVGTALFLLVPGLILSCFNAPADVVALGIPALRMISVSFLFAAVAIIFTASFQALGKPMMSLIISLLRQLVIVLPATYLLLQIDPNLVWLSIPAAEMISCIVATVFYRKLHANIIVPLL
ncbi:MAG: MATE family efflux transporter [Oscillospiraceae bacterium]